MKVIQHAERLDRVHPSLVKLVEEVAKYFSLIIICGERSKAEQDEAFNTGHSKVKWPSSKHNIMVPETHCSAIDIAPLPYDMKDLQRLCYFAGFIKAKGQDMGYNIRWGCDWDNDFELKDNTFNDYCHFELVE